MGPYSNAALVYSYYSEYNALIELFKHDLEYALYNLTPNDAVRFVLHCMSGTKAQFEISETKSKFKHEEITRCINLLPSLLSKHPFDMIVLLTNYLQQSIDRCNKDLTDIVIGFEEKDIKNLFAIQAEGALRDIDQLPLCFTRKLELLTTANIQTELNAMLRYGYTQNTKKEIANKLQGYYHLLNLIKFINTIEKNKSSREKIDTLRLGLVITSITVLIFGGVLAISISNVATMSCVMVISLLATALINLAMKHYASMRKLAINNSIYEVSKSASEYLSQNFKESTTGMPPIEYNFSTEEILSKQADKRASEVSKEVNVISNGLFVQMQHDCATATSNHSSSLSA